MGIQLDGINNEIKSQTKIDFPGSVGVAGTLTYEDVTNVDSVGVITARSGINISSGSLTIPDSIIHSGDTNTKIRFPADDTITAETGGSERVRITSGGSVLVGKTATSLTTDGIRMDSNAAMITASSTSTNQATANGGSLFLINSSATDNNFNNIGGYNSNGLVTSQINFVNTSHSSRTGDISFRTHNGSSMPERLRIDSDGYVTKPNLPYFHVTADPSITSNYVHSFANVSGNNGSHYNNTNGRFTAPVAGFYWFSVGIWCNASNGASAFLQLVRNINSSGSDIAFAGCNHVTQYNNLNASGGTYMEKDDYAWIKISGVTIQASTPRNFFSGYLVG